MQVGYGDVVAISVGGKLAIVAIICVGVVLIPVQTSQLYQQLVARRVTQGKQAWCSSLLSVTVLAACMGVASCCTKICPRSDGGREIASLWLRRG